MQQFKKNGYAAIFKRTYAVQRTAQNIQESADIVASKIKELCSLIPALSNEILWDTRGRIETTRQTKDSVIFAFKNGSTLENIACSDKTRGRRFHNGFLEEAAKLDLLVVLSLETLKIITPRIAGTPLRTLYYNVVMKYGQA